MSLQLQAADAALAPAAAPAPAATGCQAVPYSLTWIRVTQSLLTAAAELLLQQRSSKKVILACKQRCTGAHTTDKQ
jgi:hypothetical protein